MDSYYETILKKLGLYKGQTLKWFHNAAKGLKSDMIEKEEFTNHVGRLLLYRYDPKHKDNDKILPYYDVYPLVFITDIYHDGFLGINLHYLPGEYRVKLLNALWETANNDKLDKTTKLEISYKLLKGVSKYRYFKPCVKRYLAGHIKSKFSIIKPIHWGFVIQLPLAKWMKQSEARIFQDSLKKLNI